VPEADILPARRRQVDLVRNVPTWISSGNVLHVIARLALCVAASTGASASEVLWYGGDAGSGGNALSGAAYNNTRLIGGFGDSVLDDFIVPEGGWHVTGLFSNNVANYPIQVAPFSQAIWSVRTGASAGNFGQILVSGMSPVTVSPTGRFSFGAEYTVTVSGLSIDLGPGVYCMEVSPVAAEQIYYVQTSDGFNAVGPAGLGFVLQEEHFF